jgi:hypothetical protein
VEVKSGNGSSAGWGRLKSGIGWLSLDFVKRVLLNNESLLSLSVRIVNEVPHINRICYDITSKPPATVELELLTIGTVLDMYTELQRDDEPHEQLASQDDMDKFGLKSAEKDNCRN